MIVTINRVTVGIQGNYKSGYWNPVRIQVTGGQQDCVRELLITVVDGDGVPVQHVWGGDAAISISARSSQIIERCVKFGRRNRQLMIMLRDPARSGASATSRIDLPVPLNSDRELIVGWGPPVGLETAFERRLRSPSESVVLCQLADAQQLPNSALGYDAVNAVVITTSNVPLLKQIQPQQMDALQRWVERGGKLILFVGSRGDEVLGPGGVFAPLAPGVFQQVTVLRNASPLETYSGSGQRLAVASPSEGIPMTLLRDVQGYIELFDLAPGGQRAMIVRGTYGFGQVIFVAFDLDQAPFVDWEGRPRVLQRLLHESLERPDSGEGHSVARQAVQFGYKDMSGQLRSALDQFPGVTAVAFSWVAGLALLYVLLIGPADYFFLRDALKRMHWTWVTFPVVVGAFAVLVVILGNSFKGSRPLANHLDLVDLDARSGKLRGTTWSHVYSPRAAVYNVDVRPTSISIASKPPAECLVAWHGLPGTALGGLDGGPAVQVGTKSEYRLEFTAPETAVVKGIPLAVASTQSFITRWYADVQRPGLPKIVRDADGLLRGEVLNPLDVELHECMVLFENWLYRLDSRQGILNPGQRTRIEAERALNLQWRLSGRRLIDKDDISTTPWDQNTLDVNKILEMMMLHSAAGGETYTHLTNRYQHFVDLSQHLKANQAMLIGRAYQPATKMTLNDQEPTESAEQHWTYYRVVFPVDTQRD